jgi:hypothetical protein
MKVIINHNGVPREIEGPFDICIGKEDLDQIYRILKKKRKKGWHFGWINISDPRERTESSPNTKPLKWK